ncbi:MAG: hypothetical protein K1X47_13415 [Cyclobacteriaceae bacterium]|nr:hypothetical protein [Cyclobacteriaceae bacterium]
MPTGPSARAKLNSKKAHLHPLKAGKEYTVKTTRHAEGKSQIAFMMFLMKGKQRELLLKIDHLCHDRAYTVEFVAGKDEGLLLTYWERRGRKWTQINGEQA